MAGAAKGRLATAYAAVEDTTALGAGLGELDALSCAGPWHGGMSSTRLAVTHLVVIRRQEWRFGEPLQRRGFTHSVLPVQLSIRTRTCECSVQRFVSAIAAAISAPAMTMAMGWLMSGSPSQIQLIVSSYFWEGVGDDRACALVLSLWKNAKLQASKSPTNAALGLYLDGAWRQIPSDTVSSKTDC